MKKGIYVLVLLTFILFISGCDLHPAKDAKGVSGVSDDETKNIEPPTDPKTSEPINTPDSEQELYTYEIKARLHENMLEYRFVAAGKVNEEEKSPSGFIISLNIYDENGKSILSADFSETIDGNLIGYEVYNEMMDTMGLHVTDVNFDGYKDVIILNSFGGAHGNTWYDCWLWDTKTLSFSESKSFAEICNPSIDSEKKCIYSSGGSGAEYWGGRIYKFIDGEYVITNELDADMYGLVETELVNGKMEIVREVSYGDDDKALEKEREYYKSSELWQLDYPRWYQVGGHHSDKWLGGE